MKFETIRESFYGKTHGGTTSTTLASPPPLPHDAVNSPGHYTSHPSGIECIQIAEHMNFNLGNALKYLWRADLKGNPEKDLKKAIWYLRRELARRGIK